MPECIIMRGLPGCGKSRYVRNHLYNYYVVSADNFFSGEAGYNFISINLSQAHAQCRNMFRDFLEKGLNIVVDNTNISGYEYGWYAQEALDEGYGLKIITLWEDPLVCFNRNIHRVSLDVILSMYERIKEYVPKFFNPEIIHVRTSAGV